MVNVALEEVDPVGVKEALGYFPDGCRPVAIPKWDKTEQGKALRKLRKQRGLNIINAATILGLDVGQVLGIELGRYRVSEPDYLYLKAQLEEHIK